MARVVIERVVSDLSGKEIAEGKAWTMTLTPPDGRRNTVRLDISEEEARQWLIKGTEVKRRGRRPGSTTTRRKGAAAPANGRRRRKAKAAPGNGSRRGNKPAANGRKRKTAPANGRRKRRAS